VEFKLVIFDGDNVLDEREPFTFDAATDEAHWHVNHDGATKVEIVDMETGEVVDTIGERRRAGVR
jgi:hypothetical protein